ncbi:MAG: twin transmembrane helix small protein [Rhodospirillales bacterium]|nr:twin transmembrane helix small protein [Rhodospirillales bacterium]MDH3919681.1 twin transmembrane helix small protein [Rhodospirillales bacterium]MDH3969803.1 twin transmembrane helix small protein [Rhodospirillales bacterium]
MESYVPFILAAAMLAVVAVLFAGLFAMARGGEFNRKYGNKLMRWRVALQGSAILIFMLAMWLSRG